MAHLYPSRAAICANTGGITDSDAASCVKIASSACKGCLLVQYCSKECQHSHWHLHKADCRSPLIKAAWKPEFDVQGRAPAFLYPEGVEKKPGAPDPWTATVGGTQQLFSNMPAVDLLNLSKNEGFVDNGTFRLLFAASGDLRNLVKSVVSFPENYSGQCEAVMNDKDFDVVARNVILLLVALHYSPSEAVPIMLHLWYSAFLPNGTLRSLREQILPLIQRVCTKIRLAPAGSLQSKSWTFGTNSLRLVLQKEEWNHLLSFFETPKGLSKIKAQKIRRVATFSPERIDYLHRMLNCQPPSHRVCSMRFREDGILLPFGSSRASFDEPNPTFYRPNKTWPMDESADPLKGWPFSEVMQKASLAKNDVYGSLFLYVQDILWNFCTSLIRMTFNFRLFRLNALELPSISGIEKDSFDRIEVSHLAEHRHTGLLWTLNTYAPYLKPPSQNPHATLLALFLDALSEEFTADDASSCTMPEMQRLVPYLGPTEDMWKRNGRRNSDLMRFLGAMGMFRDFDKYFDRAMQRRDFNGAAAKAGLRYKQVHTVVDRWPCRLVKGARQEEFDAMLAMGRDGSQRYVEWTRSK